MKLTLGLMGAGISRSRMPQLQVYLGSQVGLDIGYQLIDGDIEPGFDPVEEIHHLITKGYHGINVTHPYKQRIYPLVTQIIVEGHENIGSYNTLVFNSDGIAGANTDYSGFISGYRYRLGDMAPGKVVICGAGGVGRAVAFGLAKLGASQISIYDVVNSQAQSLSNALQAAGFNACCTTADTLDNAIAEADGLLNCTAIGMHHHPGSPFSLSAIESQKWAFDAVYTPNKTEFIEHCRLKGLRCLSGFDLWIFQGLDAFRLFTGHDIEVTDAIISKTFEWLS